MSTSVSSTLPPQSLPPLSTLPPAKSDVNYGLLILYIIILIISGGLIFIGWANNVNNMFNNPMVLNKYSKGFAVLDYLSIIIILILSGWGLFKLF